MSLFPYPNFYAPPNAVVSNECVFKNVNKRKKENHDYEKLRLTFSQREFFDRLSVNVAEKSFSHIPFFLIQWGRLVWL